MYLAYHEVISMINKAVIVIIQAVGASTRVFTLLDRRPQMVPAGHAKPQGSPEGAHIEFRNVSFAYPSRPDIQVHCSHTARCSNPCLHFKQLITLDCSYTARCNCS